MAGQYKCDICGKPATVHITRIIDDKKIKVHLCADCAAKMSPSAGINLPEGIIPAIKKLEENLFMDVAKAAKNSVGICPSCGARLDAIEKGERFSCPDCYEALKEKLFPMLSEMHGATRHVGKRPKKHEIRADETSLPSDSLQDFSEPGDKVEEEFRDLLEAGNIGLKQEEKKSNAGGNSDSEVSKADLMQELSRAISDERYEDAALIRDKLKSMS